jgi:membrane protein implicated in regulation of membrane protease activity
MRSLDSAIAWCGSIVLLTAVAAAVSGSSELEALLAMLAALTVSVAYLGIAVAVTLDRRAARRERRVEYLLERIANSLDPPREDGSVVPIRKAPTTGHEETKSA